ncbi:thioredoxin family protein [Sinimarinibacterium sp. CAU 1509]|uniref:thioredoxin family protein n=1 Tax=Sinimarinibacterium sp. CAU 1509 TaxID=2562283 RepID=UPI0010ACC2DF|nr:thioredoxin family protein [Sinimarinibacterium sp. CAU 1509]TJY58917.1 thioredoxin family protein [Sinimarinibacterium sp. CAU 1509]
MKQIKVLGRGCANCRNTIQLIQEVATAHGEAIELEKVEDIQAIARHGVMSTPGVVIDGTVVHAGGMPSRDKVEGWFAGA